MANGPSVRTTSTSRASPRSRHLLHPSLDLPPHPPRSRVHSSADSKPPPTLRWRMGSQQVTPRLHPHAPEPPHSVVDWDGGEVPALIPDPLHRGMIPAATPPLPLLFILPAPPPAATTRMQRPAQVQRPVTVSRAEGPKKSISLRGNKPGSIA